MFLKQAAMEQRIPFEVTARPTIEYGSESMEKQRTAHRVGRRSALAARPAAISGLHTFDRSKV